MKYDPAEVKRQYDMIADDEDRQEKSPTLRTEIPREFIKKYLRETDVVLDAGGGTGINAIMMANRAKHVTLIDISSEIIKRANVNVHNAGLAFKIDVLEGDIVELGQFRDAQFTFVVCVGDAISYVLEHRVKAMQELVRVSRNDSILVIGCDSKYGFMRRHLRDGNLDEAVSINNTNETYCGMGPRTHVYAVDEMTQLVEENGCEVLEIASTPALADTIDTKQFAEPEQWERLKQLEMEICTRPELLGIGTHLLFVAKKRT